MAMFVAGDEEIVEEEWPVETRYARRPPQSNEEEQRTKRRRRRKQEDDDCNNSKRIDTKHHHGAKDSGPAAEHGRATTPWPTSQAACDGVPLRTLVATVFVGRSSPRDPIPPALGSYCCSPFRHFLLLHHHHLHHLFLLPVLLLLLLFFFFFFVGLCLVLLVQQQRVRQQRL